jgi:hypothetical protein
MKNRTKTYFQVMIFFLFTIPVKAEIQSPYLEKIKEYQLDQDPQWQRLLHYARSPLGIWKSQIDDPQFFLSPKGETDPQAELLATFEALQDPVENFAANEHPICRFPGRKRYLEQKIGLPDNFFPTPSCPLYQTFINRLQAETISIVFSSYYTNSPGSAFGHTLFKIGRKKSSPIQESDLLDYGIGYGADIHDIDPVRYGIYGIFGGFNGTFTNVPFYYKVREYNDFENRDLWTFDLKLTALERDLLIDHLWDVGAIKFNYYFFTQNCAYHMLSVLDAAAPRLSLIDRMPIWAIPGDSIKVLFQEKDFVGSIHFRPSLRRTFLTRYERLSGLEKEAFLKYIENREIQSLANLSPESKRQVLDTALDEFDFRHPKEVTKANSPEAQAKNQILLARAALGLRSPSFEIIPRDEESPQKGHSSSRLSLGYSQRDFFDQKQDRIDLRFRFALHDFLDPVEGYPEWAQLEFGNFQFYYTPKEKDLRLTEFWFFQAMTAQPLSQFEKHLTWRGRLGAKEFSGLKHLGTGTDFGMGATFSLHEKSQTALMALINFEIFYQHEVDKDFILGAGPELALLTRPDKKWAGLFRFQRMTYAQKGFNNDTITSAQLRYTLNTQSTVFVDYKSSLLLNSIPSSEKETDVKVSAGLHYFF